MLDLAVEEGGKDKLIAFLLAKIEGSVWLSRSAFKINKSYRWDICISISVFNQTPHETYRLFFFFAFFFLTFFF